MEFLIKKSVIHKVFILLILLISAQSVYAQSVNVTAPLSGVNITAGTSFNINWTSGSGDDHHKIGYTTSNSAACTGSGGSSGEITGWTLLCHDLSCGSSPRATTLELNSSTVRVKVTGHDGSHVALTNNCSDVFTIASISSAPTNLISSVTNLTSLTLSWDTQLSTDLVSKYLIFRDSVNIANTSDNNTLSYIETGLNSSLYYNYTIKTNNPIGDSVFSNELNVSTSSFTTPPATIGNLTTVDIGDNHIYWNWTNPADSDFNHTLIYRNGVFITNVYSPNNSYNLTGLVAGTPYTISIRTVDNDSNVNTTFVNSSATTSGDSGCGSCGGGGESVTVTSPNGGEDWETSSSHDITWTSSNIDHFEIWYSTDSGSSWILLEAHPYGSSSTTSYSWTLPSSTSSTMRVRVDGHDSGHSVQATDESNADFTLSTPTTSSSSSSSGSGGGGGSTTTAVSNVSWSKIYSEDDEELSEKISLTKTLGTKEKVNIKIDNEVHSVGVIELTNTTALVEISSDPQRATLTIGEEKKFNVNDDDFYDVLVRLKNITDGKAELIISYIHEEVPTNSLYSITLKLANSLIKYISELIAIITFQNFGNISIPINLTFVILDKSGSEVYREQDNITILTEKNLEKKFEDVSLPDGKYELVLTTLYNVSIIQELRQKFEINKNYSSKKSWWVNSLWYIIIIFVGVIIFISIWYFINKFRNSKEKGEQLIKIK